MVINFTRQLYILMKAGIPLLKALQIVCAQLPAGKFKIALDSVVQDIQEGKSFSEGISSCPRFFSLFYINMIKAAEVSGNLTGILKELSQHLLQQRRIIRQVQVAVMYPVFVLIVAAIILVVLLVFVMPVFIRIFEDLGGQLPPMTLLLINFSKFVAQWGWLFLCLLAALVAVTFLLYHKTTSGRRFLNRLTWKIPMFGHVLKTVEIGRFCRTLGTLLSSGVMLIKGMDVLIETSQGIVLREALEDIRSKIEQGVSLSLAMEEAAIFPLTLTRMIQVGEESGKIADLFSDAAQDYEEEVSYQVTGVLSLLEPVMIVVMGAIVGFIVVSLFFPIFTISGLVK